MAKQTIKSNNAIFTIQYRAVCLERDYFGRWRDNEDIAYQDAINHQKKYNHAVEIEVEQKQVFSISVTDINH